MSACVLDISHGLTSVSPGNVVTISNVAVNKRSVP